MRFARLILLAVLGIGTLCAQWGGELRFCIRSEPRSFHPALADSDAAETIRYLTGGVLVRVNRGNQQLEPELATSWKIEDGGKSIVFQLRQGLKFSDGTPFTAADVVYTMNVLLDPAMHSATGDTFPADSGAVKAVARGTYTVAVEFPVPVAGALRLFDQVAILSRDSPLKERAVLGAFRIAEHKPGSYILLARNPELLADRPRQAPALSRRHPPGGPTEPRDRTAALPARAGAPDFLAVPRPIPAACRARMAPWSGTRGLRWRAKCCGST